MGRPKTDLDHNILGSPIPSKLVRPLQPMPDFVRAALDERELRERYDARPDYQRNDYLMWINKAKREDTKRKRLSQMLEELEAGGVYMRMKWNG
ncbi:YdeI/OmpD-associated family protein [Devosia sp. XK-2]|uniref:YdeI/OmpD-associated family protein n=1 Tax=Devosia sp. XK-2 TaxID=3126689 RepID=UPI0030D61337